MSLPSKATRTPRGSLVAASISPATSDTKPISARWSAAFGKGVTAGVYARQVGFQFGENDFANALNYSAFGCEAVANRYNIAIHATNLTWYGGTVQSASAADILVGDGLQGYSTLQGFRSEGSAMLLDSSSGQSAAWNLRLADIEFALDKYAGNALVRYGFGRGTLTLGNIRTAAVVPLTGTATAGSLTTLTDAAKTFNTATITYANASTTSGLTGWDLQLTGGTGVGQRRAIASNTATVLTVNPAFTVAPDTTTTYQVMPRTPVFMGGTAPANLVLRNPAFTGTPLAWAVQTNSSQNSGWSAIVENYAELDKDGNLLLGAGDMTHGVVYFTGGTPQAPAVQWAAPGSPSTGVDTVLFRSGTGTVGATALATPNLRVQSLGATVAPVAAARGTTGSTTYNYKVVAIDGAGNSALPSASFSVTNANATLSRANYVVFNWGGSTVPPICKAFNVLKDDGTGTYKLLATVPWAQLQLFQDWGQPLTTYSAPISDATGTLAVDGASTLTGAVAMGGAATVGGTLAVTGASTVAALTASGLILANGGISGPVTLVLKTSSYTAQTSDEIILCDCTSNPITITLPTSASFGAHELLIAKTDSSSNAVTILASGSDTINGATTQSAAAQYAGFDLFADGGTKWYIAASTVGGATSVAASGVVPGSFASGGYTFPGTLTVTTSLTSSGPAVFNNNVTLNQWIGQKYFNAGNSGTALTLNGINGSWQKFTLNGNCTLTITVPAPAGVLRLWLIQDATGSRTVTWPATVKWAGGTAPTLTTTPAKTDIISLMWDGTSLWGEVVGQNY